MAYDTDTPPALIAQAVGGITGMRWYGLMWNDPIAAVLAPGYISNAREIGMRAGDGLVYKDVNRGEWDQYDLIVDSINADGAATIKFPEIPEEAMALIETFDVNDPSAYIVVMIGGRQVRVDASNFGSDNVQNASVDEAKLGERNDRRMTPFTTRAAIDFRVPQLIGAALGPGIAALDNRDTLLDTDRFLVVEGQAPFKSYDLAWAQMKTNLRITFATRAFVSTAAPTANFGVDGDVWYQI